jgi:hypothetical protein
MRFTLLKIGAVVAVVALTSWGPAAQRSAGVAGTGPALQSIGPLAFGPSGVLFAADTEAAAIYAFELGSQAGTTAGVRDLPAIDQTIAALLGTGVREIAVTDLAVHPQTKNAFISVMRGQGTASSPVLLRVDGAGKIDVLVLNQMTYTKAILPNAPEAETGRRNPRVQSVTDMAYMDGKLVIAGLSNEEFSSKLRTVAYPFATVDNGVSVEIYHGNHQQLETRSPVYTFVPYVVNNEPTLIAGYLCTPLVKFPLSSLTPGAKVRGTTIAELGAGNRPLDMILYEKNNREYLLMSNNSRGVMKIATEGFGNAAAITAPVTSETGGVPYETIATMTGVEQLDKLNDAQSIVLARAGNGALNLQAVALP